MDIKEQINNIFQKQKPHVHFIGIGGKGLYGIARILRKEGWRVSGSDSNKQEELRKMGIEVFQGHKESHLNRNVDLVVYSSVIKPNNPEIQEAQQNNIPTIKRSVFLAYLMKKYTTSISIVGSHGKSTTTALIGLILGQAGKQPTVFGGAHIKEKGSYEIHGSKDFCVVEACEYDRSFHDLVPDISIMTSLEKSHMEYYKTERNMNNAFREYVTKHSKDACIIANGDCLRLREILKNFSCKVIFYGFNLCNDYVIKKVVIGCEESKFSVYKGSKEIATNIPARIPGTYNMLNIAATSALLDHLRIPQENIGKVTDSFTGVGRRFEIIELDTNETFIDDFAHHPTQVKNLCESIKQRFPKKKVCTVFQPRQYHLIETFLTEYGAAFRGVDEVIVTDIVPALGDTKEDIAKLDPYDVIFSIQKNAGIGNVHHISDVSKIVSFLQKKDLSTYVVVTIGAGDIYKVRDMFIKRSNKKVSYGLST